MSEKEKIQQIIKDWKTLKTDAEKELFLERTRKNIGNKGEEELMEGVKAVHESIHNLHTEVTLTKPEDTLGVFRISIKGVFSTIDDLLKNDKLTKSDQTWLEKELEAMEKKLIDYKRKHERKVKAS